RLVRQYRRRCTRLHTSIRADMLEDALDDAGLSNGTYDSQFPATSRARA
ncbi:MAG: hypothetical protein ACI9W2_002899, partial [Gammaproteobacteria bacterium]